MNGVQRNANNAALVDGCGSIDRRIRQGARSGMAGSGGGSGTERGADYPASRLAFAGRYQIEILAIGATSSNGWRQDRID